MLKRISHKIFLFLTLSTILVNTSWGYAQVRNIQNNLSFSGLTFLKNPIITSHPNLLSQENNVVLYQPGGIRYYQSLRNGRDVFVEISSILDEDNPLEEFSDYLQDPVNWDPTLFIDRRFVYTANVRFQQHRHFFGRTHAIHVGLTAHAEEAHTYYVSRSHAQSLGVDNQLNLIDIRYAPYLTFHSEFLDWLTFAGDVRVNFLHFDTQNVCRTTCSLQPKTSNDRFIPSVRGHFIFHPWPDTVLFMNIGTGYHRFQDREPIGSTTVEQLSQVISYQIGLHFNLSQGINVSASLWQANLDSDRIFFGEEGDVQITGPSRRRGIQLKGEISIPQKVHISGNITYAHSTLRRIGESIPLSPAVTIESTIHKNWGQQWSSTLRIRHIGQRSAGDNTDTGLRPVTTWDVTTNYHFKESATTGRAEVFLGVINLSNSTAPHSQFFFDTGWTSEYSQVFNLNYFPGQSRTIIGGMTWDF